MQPIYLDNNATTRTAPEVLEEMLPFLGELYGNPSSMHSFGGQVGKYLDTARERAAQTLGCHPQEIIFTSCGSESDNTAIHSALAPPPPLPPSRKSATSSPPGWSTRLFCPWQSTWRKTVLT